MPRSVHFIADTKVHNGPSSQATQSVDHQSQPPMVSESARQIKPRSEDGGKLGFGQTKSITATGFRQSYYHRHDVRQRSLTDGVR
jgi:hypothetical protein